MNVRKLIVDYMKQNRYTALIYSGQCACKIDDLIPCEEDCSLCNIGYWCEKNDCGCSKKFNPESDDCKGCEV